MKPWLAIWLGIAALLVVVMAGCTMPEPPRAAWQPRPPPPEMRPCLPPVKPPRVPPAPRSVESVADYAWAEARARWTTADRLRVCAARLAEAYDWIEENR
tara:strand:- start:17450 stop:17749 length:300 start_codon:yes stop_codon:yes gene_type:complete